MDEFNPNENSNNDKKSEFEKIDEMTDKLSRYPNYNNNYQQGYYYQQGTGHQAYQSNFGAIPPQYTGTEKKKGYKAKKAVKYAVCALCLGVIASIGFQGTNYIGNNIFHNNQVSPVRDTPSLNVSSEPQKMTIMSDVSQLIQENKPAMVSISCITTQQMQDFFNGAYVKEIPVSGSGFIISEDKNNLYIATNNHVIENGKNISVSFVNDSVAKARVMGTDPYNDLAVVAVSKKDMKPGTYEKIKVAILGDSDKLVEGEPVIAMGNALGIGQSTTNGIISALHRQITTEEGNKMSDLIQTNAAINPGNSGGALLDAAGHVIGINTAKTSAEEIEGVGYAIPISKAQPILKNILDNKQKIVSASQRGMLGVKGLAISPEVNANYQIPMGFYVREVVKGSGAERAGIHPGDVIIAINGFKVENIEDIANRMAYFKVGEAMPITIMTQVNGKYVQKKIKVVISKKSDSNSEENSPNSSQSQQDNSPSPNIINPFSGSNDGNLGDIFRFNFN